MSLLTALIVVSEKAANVARLCRHNHHLFHLLIQQKTAEEANPRFVEDFKTLADVLIQELVKSEITNQFPELKVIRGEENNIFSNKLGKTIRVEVKANVEATTDLLAIVLDGDRTAAGLLAHQVHQDIALNEIDLEELPNLETIDNIDLSNVGIWIDPIDSTSEYINNEEEDDASAGSLSTVGLKCVTVLIGVYDLISGLPIVGVINQPFHTKESCDKWRGKCQWGYHHQDIIHTTINQHHNSNRCICVSKTENPQIVSKLQQNGFQVIEIAGAGYKILTVINGQMDAFVLSKNTTYKWDTCAPQAILRSIGGDVVHYEEALRGRMVSVAYDGEEKQNSHGIIAYRQREILMEIVDCLMKK